MFTALYAGQRGKDSGHGRRRSSLSPESRRFHHYFTKIHVKRRLSISSAYLLASFTMA